VQYKISHTTIYTYNQLVYLKPHLLRLHPRCDRWQKLHCFALEIAPEPAGISYFNDFDGNNLIKLWFRTTTEQLTIKIHTEVETHKNNPFDYLLESWATKIPWDYPSSMITQLDSYLKSYYPVPDPVACQLAQEIAHQAKGNVLTFLSNLNQNIYENCQYIIREMGEAMPAGITWNSKQGSCRDFAVLFMEVCRAVGLGARFVSGYQEGDRDQEERDLHAWTEVYLPGGGWRGYDPTLGLAVADRHIAVSASSLPQYTAPVEGHVTPVEPTWETGKAVESQMRSQISITHLDRNQSFSSQSQFRADS
jgi:transglutaminase-like putative cysteine protease